MDHVDHVMIVDDDREIRELAGNFLKKNGLAVTLAADGRQMRTLLESLSVDLIVLDIMMPGDDGLQLCRELRVGKHKATPVLMLTARDPVDDRVQGFALGADDYLVKPFSLKELDARIKALVRRAQGRQVQGTLVWEDLQVDTRAPQAWRQGRSINLTPTTHKLLLSLVRAAPDVVRKREAEYLLWGEAPPEGGALRTHMHDLRRQIDKNFTRALIETVHGIGWRLHTPQEAAPK